MAASREASTSAASAGAGAAPAPADVSRMARPSSGGPAGRRPYRSRLRAAANPMVRPSTLGDPVTALAFAEAPGLLLTGSALGSVTAWQVEHLLDDAADAARPTPLPGLQVSSKNDESGDDPGGAPAYACVRLCERSDEGVWAVRARDDGVLAATVGDVSAKLWKSYGSSGYTLFKFQRTHNHFVCNASRTLQSGPHVLVLRVASNDALYVNVDTLHQEKVRFSVPARAHPSFWDGAHLVVREVAETGEQTVRVWDFWHYNVLAEVSFPRAGKAYWGFAVRARQLAYVSNARHLKVTRLRHAAEPAPATDGDDDENGGGGESDAGDGHVDVDTEKLTSKSYFAKLSHGGDVLAFAFTEDGEHIVSLAADRVVRVWNIELRRDVVSFRGVAGEFGSGHPQQLLFAHGERGVFYTADDGVYYISLGDDWH